MNVDIPFRLKMNRIMFNTHAADWSECMEKCLKYNRSMAPSFSTKEEMDELISWTLKTTSDPMSLFKSPYLIWLPYRFVY